MERLRKNRKHIWSCGKEPNTEPHVYEAGLLTVVSVVRYMA